MLPSARPVLFLALQIKRTVGMIAEKADYGKVSPFGGVRPWGPGIIPIMLIRIGALLEVSNIAWVAPQGDKRLGLVHTMWTSPVFQ